MSVLVDTSVWIDYFRGSDKGDTLELLIEDNLVVVNNLILAELIPSLNIKRQRSLITLLYTIKRQPVNINWSEIIKMQTLCLKKGINKVGLPDLMIAQNAMQGDLRLLSNDKHFQLISKHLPIEIYFT